MPKDGSPTLIHDVSVVKLYIVHSRFVRKGLSGQESVKRPLLPQGAEVGQGLWILLPFVTPDGLPPHVATPTDDAFRGSQGRSCRPDVEVEDGLTCGLRLAGVVVDYVSDLFPLAVDLTRDIPVVPIKGRLGTNTASVSRILKWTVSNIATHPNLDG
jgi:hypothetical protein